MEESKLMLCFLLPVPYILSPEEALLRDRAATAKKQRAKTDESEARFEVLCLDILLLSGLSNKDDEE